MPYPVIPGTPVGNAELLPAAGVLTASNAAAAGASNSVTLPAVSGQTNYLTGFIIGMHVPSTGVPSGLVTVTGAMTGTLNYYIVDNATYGGELIVMLPSPIPASGPNTAITVNLPAITNGGASSITVTGFVQ